MMLSAVALLTVCLTRTLAQSEIECEYPSDPDHGRGFLVGDKPIVGSYLVYTCNENRQTVGSATARCTDSGKWSSPKPRCVEISLYSLKTSTSTRSPTSTTVRFSTSTPVLSTISTSVEAPISSHADSTGIEPPSVANSQPPPSQVGSNSNCTCTYINSDANLVAYANTQRLRSRDLVADGYNIKFHCSPLGYYRLRGPSNITCRYCRTWFSSEYPKCVLPRMGDAVIRIQGADNVTEFPGGYLGVPQGSLLRLVCLHYSQSNRPQFDEDSPPFRPSPEFNPSEYWPEMELPPDQPGWEFSRGSKATPNTVVYNQVVYEHGKIIKTQVLEFSNVDRKHNDVYHCAVRYGSRNMSIGIQTITPDATCPQFNQDEDFTVQYDKGQNFNSIAVFSCKNSNERIVGYPNLTCMSNGHWSADPPQCMKICPKLQETESLRIHYSNLQETDSTANFHCQPPRMLKGVSYTRCKADGQWTDPVPTCELSMCPLSDLYGELAGNVLIITGEAVKNTLIPYNFSLRLNCASNGRMNGVPGTTVRCGLGGVWEVGDTSTPERAPPGYGGYDQSPSLGRPPRPSIFGGPLESSSLRYWYETCFGSNGPSYLRGSYTMYSRSKTTKRP